MYYGDGLVSKSCPTLAIPWTVAHQASLSIGFPRQKCWSEVPFPSPGDFPHPGMEQRSPVPLVDSLPTEPPGKPLDVFRPLIFMCIPVWLMQGSWFAHIPLVWQNDGPCFLPKEEILQCGLPGAIWYTSLC